jgi:hypothetical protein
MSVRVVVSSFQDAEFEFAFGSSCAGVSVGRFQEWVNDEGGWCCPSVYPMSEASLLRMPVVVSFAELSLRMEALLSNFSRKFERKS